MTIFFHYAPKEIICPTHGRIQEEIPWAAANSRVTYRFEYAILVYCQMMTQKAAAQLLGIPASTLADLLHRVIHPVRDGHRLRGLKIIGVDEFAYHRGKRYATIIYDLARRCVVWIGKGKGREVIDRFFTEVLSSYQRVQITWATCDISRTYIAAIRTYCPNARLVLDHFHVTKALNEALDEIRKEEWRKLPRTNGKALKGLRWLLLTHTNNRSRSDTRILNELKKSNRRIYRAWILKDEFERFWHYIYPNAARKFAQGWITAALRSRLEPMRAFARMLKSHLNDILSYIGSHLTNAIGEGINRIIKIIKNRASGFRNLNNFVDMIYLIVGDVDIPAQIPKCFCTL